MQWGVRKVPQRSTTTNKKGKPLSARKVHRNKVRNAISKKLSTESSAMRDDRSERTKKLGKAQVGTMLGGIGALTIAHTSRSPRVVAGAAMATVLLAGSSLVFDVKESNAAKRDLLRVYGN
jgi:hypothetical protein